MEIEEVTRLREMFQGASFEFYCTKGLDAYKVRQDTFVISDILGNSSLPFIARDHESLCSSLWSLARINPLMRGSGALLRRTHDIYDSAIPYECEEIYTARFPDYYRIWLCGLGDWSLFDSLLGFLPSAYLDYGYGDGGKEDLEQIHNATIQLIKAKKIPLTEEVLFSHLLCLQLKRICDDIIALLHRASIQFRLLLNTQRKAIVNSIPHLRSLETSELLHISPTSHATALCATNICISLCTSLDLASKLLWFINDNEIPTLQFHPARGKHFEELRMLRPKALPESTLTAIKESWSAKYALKELVQFRNDLVHTTTALELERKLYVGFGGDEIKNLFLHYSFQPWRDTNSSGQPDRFLGRDYFTAKNIDIELTLYRWINGVFDGHIETGKMVLSFLQKQRPTHRLSGV